jgi:hypothetical protein
VTVPDSLRRWFVVHFVADMLFAVPMFVAPTFFLGLFGWEHVDPITTRIVAAALFGIGIESLLGRNAEAPAFVAMLNLKVIWASTATIGIAWGTIEGGNAMGWAFAGTFAAFLCVWSYYRLRLRAA